MKLSDLSGNPRNPRKITDEKLKMLEKALNEFGDLSGIVFNRRSGQLVGGHQRLKVLPHDAEIVIDQKLSTPTTTGTVAEGHVLINGESFRYREVDWDDTKEKAANIAANKHGGEFDLPILSEWLLELDSMNIDMDLTGFDQTELENLMAPVQQVEGQCDEDEVPEVQAEPITKRGDIYQLGRHRLMCGDSTSIDDVEKLMAGEKADMVFTDPPYNIAEKCKGIAGHAPTNHQSEKLMAEEWDKGFDFDSVSASIFSALADSCSVYVTTSSFVAPKIWAWMEACFDLAGYCVWSKPNPFPSLMKRHWAFSTELVCYATRGKHTFNYPEQGNALSVWTIPIGEGGLHPTQKPVKVPEHAILHSSKVGDIVMDLFGGSGSTLVACEKNGRDARLMELDPKYCDVIVARWEKFTGKKAELLTAEVPNS